MREEYLFPIRLIGPVGITPAHAGRMLLISNRVPYNPGSPPRMREEFLLSFLSSPIFRITPAHAGRIQWLRRTRTDF